jgi:hypothetical protein
MRSSNLEIIASTRLRFNRVNGTAIITSGAKSDADDTASRSKTGCGAVSEHLCLAIVESPGAACGRLKVETRNPKFDAS